MSLSFLNIENILVFEDSQEDQFIIKRKLDQAGLRAALHFCNDKVSFLHQIAKNIPDIILSDYHIPGIHGYEILELCKARFPNVPFIFVTGKITEDIAEETVLVDADAYLLKDKIDYLPSMVKLIWNNHIHSLKLKFQNSELDLLRKKMEEN